MRVTKAVAPIETKLNLDGMRIELYQADQAADPPGHSRVTIAIPGEPTPVRVDLPLDQVLDKKQLKALESYRQAFLDAALSQGGYTESPDDETANELSAAAR